MKRYRMMGLLLAVSLICPAGVAQAELVNLIPNGSFDAGVEGWSGGGCWWYPDGGILIFGGPAWLLPPTLTTPVVAGQSYTLSFDAWAATGEVTNPEQSAMAVGFSNVLGPLEIQLTNTPQTFSYTYTAPAADDGLNQIAFLNNLSYWTGHTPAGAPCLFALDNVSLVAVPEPASLVLSGLGLIGLLAYAWRKRR